MPRDEWRHTFLNQAAAILYQRDRHLIVEGQERAAASKLACHLRDVLEADGFTHRFPDVRVDVEYTQDGDDSKRATDGSAVVPDIIVHVPGKRGPNIAVVEVKGWWNRDDTKDREKLLGYLANQGYAFAYFMRIGKEHETITPFE